MSSPVKGNFGHIRELGVLLTCEEDSDMKHKRNIILATASAATLFFGLGATKLIEESLREKRIRNIGRNYPELPYARCCELETYGVTLHKGYKIFINSTKISSTLVTNEPE